MSWFTLKQISILKGLNFLNRKIYQIQDWLYLVFPYPLHRQDLNVSFLKGQKYKLQNRVEKINKEVHVSPQKFKEISRQILHIF